MEFLVNISNLTYYQVIDKFIKQCEETNKKIQFILPYQQKDLNLILEYCIRINRINKKCRITLKNDSAVKFTNFLQPLCKQFIVSPINNNL